MASDSAAKTGMRQRSLELRRSLRPEEVAGMSREIEKRLADTPVYRSAKTVATYVSKWDEADTRSIIERSLSQGKRLLVPRTDPARKRLVFHEISRPELDLSPGRMGILEPSADAGPVRLSEADLVLVPVVAWDERGYRLGYGKGYFDRELRLLPERIVTAGLAFECQRYERIPNDPHDIPVTIVVTERRVVKPARHDRSSQEAAFGE